MISHEISLRKMFRNIDLNYLVVANAAYLFAYSFNFKKYKY